jgi:hypothetical protein
MHNDLYAGQGSAWYGGLLWHVHAAVAKYGSLSASGKSLHCCLCWCVTCQHHIMKESGPVSCSWGFSGQKPLLKWQ